jgi:hypothetical protein
MVAPEGRRRTVADSGSWKFRPETAAALACLLLAAGAGSGQDRVEWMAGDGDWGDPGNWSPSRVPGLGDRAALGDLGAGGYVVTLKVAGHVGAFELVAPDPKAAPVEITGATLTVEGASVLHNALLAGVVRFESFGPLEFTGDVCNDLIDTPLDHTGSKAEWTDGNIRILQGGRLTNGPLSRFSILSARKMVGDSTGRFTNAGTLCKESPGTTSISGVTFESSGEVCVTEGTLVIDDPMPAVALEEGAWVVENTGPTATLDVVGAAYHQIDGAQVTLGGDDSFFDAITSLDTVGPGARSLFKIRNGKTLVLPALTVEQSGQVRVGETGTLNSTLTIGGPLTNNGSVHIAPGAGTLFVDGQLVGPGGQFSGSGVQVGSLGNNGAVAPGPDEADGPDQAGLLVIEDGVYRQGQEGRLIIDIEGLIPGEEYDVLQVPLADFAAERAGLLEVRLSGTFRPAVGDRFEVLRYQERRGEFAEYAGLQGQGVTFRPVYEPQALVLLVLAVECYADCDRSGQLDFFDFLCFQNAFATGEPYADCDGSGELDFFDFLCFQNEFAAGCR